MRKVVLTIFIIVLIQGNVLAQSIQDTILFIKEKVEASSPSPSFRKNYIYFRENI